MTKEDITLIQRSWHTIDPVKRVAAELFYVKLFELDPTLKLLFSDDMKLREQKFMQLMDATINGLERADVLMPAVWSWTIDNFVSEGVRSGPGVVVGVGVEVTAGWNKTNSCPFDPFRA